MKKPRSFYGREFLAALPVVLPAIGLVLAGVLSASYLLGFNACGLSDCDAVSHSVYGKAFGIPVAVWGVTGYGLLLALSALHARGLRRAFGIGYGVAFFGLLVSLYLVGVASLALHTVCPLCLASAFLMAMTALSYASLALDAHSASPPRSAFYGAAAIIIFGAGVGGWTLNNVRWRTLHTEERVARTEIDVLTPTGAMALGDPAAPRRFVLFHDFDCAACGELIRRALPLTEQKRACIVLRNAPLPIHRNAVAWAVLFERAVEVGRGREFLRRKESGEWLAPQDALVSMRAAKLGTTDAARAKVERDRLDFDRLGARYTPVLIETTGGIPRLASTDDLERLSRE